MFTWFVRHASLRVKFTILTVVYTGVAVAGLITTYFAAVTDPSQADIYIWIAGGLSIFTIVVALASKKAICDPLATTVVRMEDLAAGDLASDVRYTEHSDCVGRLTKAMVIFRGNAEQVRDAGEKTSQVVARLGSGLSSLAIGDLSHRIETPFPAEYEALRHDYNRAVIALTQAMSAIANATGGIDTGAGEIRQASDDLAHRTEQQAASLEETAAAMDEITGTVRRTAESAARANAAIEQTGTEARQSGDIVRRTVEAMGDIERSSSEISEIISVIDGIAFQTNLLALNAGVEAARAGDAGRGFAVVASEVRALAQRSADAANDVKHRIGVSSRQVETGVALVGETGASLERIFGRIGEISQLVAAITESANQQATGLQQVNMAVSEMDGVTQQNAAMVEEATAAAHSLADEAAVLVREVARFAPSNAAPKGSAGHAANVRPLRNIAREDKPRHMRASA